MVLMFWQASEISPLINVDSGVVVPVIADRPGATVNGVRVDVTAEIIKEKYTKIVFEIEE